VRVVAVFGQNSFKLFGKRILQNWVYFQYALDGDPRTILRENEQLAQKLILSKQDSATFD